jgi:hypothetical protein
MRLIPRKDRRKQAKEKGVPFTPVYSEGKKPQTHAEMYGKGRERFSNKFVHFSKEDV